MSKQIANAILKLSTDDSELRSGLKSSGLTAAREFEKMGRSARNVGAGLSVVSAAVGGAALAAVKFSTDMNAGMSSVASLIPGNVARVEELKDSVQALAVDTGKSTSDLTDGLYNVISAFGDTNDTVQILEQNAKAAAAGLATTTDAIALTSAVTKGYGDTTAEAVSKASDLAFTAVRLGQTTFPELASSIGRVVPLTSELNVSQEELFATMASLTGVTGSASEVSTQLRGVLQSMMAPTADMSTLLASMGVESGKALIEQEGLQGAVEAVTAAAERTGQPLQKFISSIEGQTAALALSGSQAGKYQAALGEMRNSLGATEEAYSTVTDGINSTGHQWDQFVQRLAVAAQNVGDGLAPALIALFDAAEPVLGIVESLASGFADLDPPLQLAIAGVAGLGLAVGPVLAVLGQMMISMSGLIPVLAKMKAGAVALAGVQGLGGLALTIGKFAGAAGLVALTIFQVVRAVKEFRAWRTAVNEANRAIEESSRAVRQHAEILREHGHEVEDNYESIIELGQQLGFAASERRGHAEATQIMIGILSSLREETDAVSGAEREAIQVTQEFTTALFDLDRQLGDTFEERLQQARQELQDTGVDVESVSEILSGFGHNAEAEAERAMQGLLDFLQDYDAELETSISDTADANSRALADLEESHLQFWLDTIEAQRAAVDNSEDEWERWEKVANEALGNVVSEMADALADGIFEAESFSDALVDIFQDLGKSIFKALVTDGLAKIATGISGLFTGGGPGGGGAIGNALGSLFGGRGGGIATDLAQLGPGAVGPVASSAGGLLGGLLAGSGILSGVLTAGIGTAIGFGVQQLTEWVSGLFGQGRQAADEFVQGIQNDFSAAVGDLVDSFGEAASAGTLTLEEAREARTALSAMWNKFNEGAEEFATQSENHDKVVRQGLKTIQFGDETWSGWGQNLNLLFTDIDQVIAGLEDQEEATAATTRAIAQQIEAQESAAESAREYEQAHREFAHGVDSFIERVLGSTDGVEKLETALFKLEQRGTPTGFIIDELGRDIDSMAEALDRHGQELPPLIEKYDLINDHLRDTDQSFDEFLADLSDTGRTLEDFINGVGAEVASLDSLDIPNVIDAERTFLAGLPPQGSLSLRDAIAAGQFLSPSLSPPKQVAEPIVFRIAQREGENSRELAERIVDEIEVRSDLRERILR